MKHIQNIQRTIRNKKSNRKIGQRLSQTFHTGRQRAGNQAHGTLLCIMHHQGNVNPHSSEPPLRLVSFSLLELRYLRSSSWERKVPYSAGIHSVVSGSSTTQALVEAGNSKDGGEEWQPRSQEVNQMKLCFNNQASQRRTF